MALILLVLLVVVVGKGDAKVRGSDMRVSDKGRESRPPVSDTFSAAIVPHRSMLLGLAYRLTRRREDADDLLQDTLLRAYRAWDRFQPGSNCRAWLSRIMMNCFVSGYRRMRRHERFVANTYAQETSCPTQIEDPRKRLDSGLGDEVTSALGTLTPIHREVVELADVRGVQYREIAEELEVPIGTVMSRLFRARRQLEEHLHEYARVDYGMCRAA